MPRVNVQSELRPEQTPLTELLSEALAVLHDALDELPWVVTTDVVAGVEVLDACGRLERMLSARVRPGPRHGPPGPACLATASLLESPQARRGARGAARQGTSWLGGRGQAGTGGLPSRLHNKGERDLGIPRSRLVRSVQGGRQDASACARREDDGMPRLHVQNELRRIEQTTPPGAERVQALTALGEQLVKAMVETTDPRERYRLRGMQHHVMRLAEDERRAAP